MAAGDRSKAIREKVQMITGVDNTKISPALIYTLMNETQTDLAEECLCLESSGCSRRRITRKSKSKKIGDDRLGCDDRAARGNGSRRRRRRRDAHCQDSIFAGAGLRILCRANPGAL